jgi:hypothetical protein
MSNNSNNYKILQPTVQGTTGSPQQAAFDSQKAAAAKLQSLQNAVGGKRNVKKRTKRRFAGGKIVVPQLQPMYTEVGGPGQTVGDTITSITSTQANSTANAQFDKLALQSGGNLYMNPNTNKYQWGCYSGGKKYKTRGKKMRKASRKTKKTRKSKKTRKNRSSKK